jgi:hypothetical protein
MRHRILMQVRVLVPLMAAMLGGCAMLDFLPDWSADRVAGPEPAYRFIVASRINQIVGREGVVGTLQISGVRRVDSLKGAAWLVCVQTENVPLPRYYAVFIQRDQIVDSRLSVLIDQCELQSFERFDWNAEANIPPPAR